MYIHIHICMYSCVCVCVFVRVCVCVCVCRDFDVFSATEAELLMYVVEVYKERGLATTFQIDDATLVNIVAGLRRE